MVSDKGEVKLLQLLCHMLNAKLVIEVGVFIGYTTLAVAQKLPAEGKGNFIHSTCCLPKLKVLSNKCSRWISTENTLQSGSLFGRKLDKHTRLTFESRLLLTA